LFENLKRLPVDSYWFVLKGEPSRGEDERKLS